MCGVRDYTISEKSFYTLAGHARAPLRQAEPSALPTVGLPRVEAQLPTQEESLAGRCRARASRARAPSPLQQRRGAAADT